ncbi:MAG: NADH-quinone oxidoreductase subunit J [Pseudomonadota bacterium]|nr:NADH-quinone oxidoreductase subunit J [Pseudomonadota bacterium]
MTQIAHEIAFYGFSTLLIAAAVAVVLARQPVHGVLALIAAFFATAGLMLDLGAEFLALILIIVYVGAVAVLFLFVVMMLDIDIAALKTDWRKLTVFGLVLAIELALGLFALAGNETVAELVPAGTSNTETLGRVLYTDYALAFQTTGLILLVSMIGAVVLMHRRRPKIGNKSARRRDETVSLVKIEPWSGVN